MIGDIFWAVCLRTWRKTLRRPVILSFSLVQPLLWMLLFGFLFQRFPLELGAPVSYASFVLPGICAMTVLFGASQAGIGLIRDLQTKFLQRMRATRATGREILGGKILADALRLLVQALLVLLLGLLIGARLDPSAGACLLALLALGLFAIAMASLSSLIALKARTAEAMAVFVHLVNMPLLFTSTALVPARQMPDWLQAIAAGNPLTLTVDALRGALLFQQSPPGVTLLPLAALAATLFWFACIAYRTVSDTS